jgi:nitrite reductase/ring-hydroxylating ferredoxin subunit
MSSALKSANVMDPAQPATMQEAPAVKVLGQLEEMSWLETTQQGITELLQPVVTKAEETGVMDFLHGRWLGHAFHPVLSDLPLGLWTASVLFDTLNMDDAAAVMSGVGSSAAVGAALTGLADWTVTHGRERRLALLHGLLNTGGLLLQIGSLAARLGGRRKWGRSLGWLGWIVSLGAAYVGGDLVFGRGLMVDHNAWKAGPQEWTAVAKLTDLQPGRPRKVQADGRAILLYREGADVYAMEDACSHAGGPLSEGEVNSGVVTCPWHGSQFRLTDGSVRRGPATYPQLRLEARIRGDHIEVRGRQG